MRKVSRLILVSAVGMVVAGSLALAADQTILGRVLTVKNPGDPIKRKIVGVGKEKASPNTIVGNPTLAGPSGGGILRVIANGGTPGDQTFVLPQGTSSTGKPFWVATGSTGFKYRDSKGDQGPVKGVTIKRSNSGNFLIKATLTGRNGAVAVVPPNPGTSGFVTLELGQVLGERYCVQYGPESQIKNNGTKLFRAKKPTAQGCPGIGTTTTTSTPTTTTTTTTIYGSPSRAFLAVAADLLD
jgi:hypothetical protein